MFPVRFLCAIPLTSKKGTGRTESNFRLGHSGPLRDVYDLARLSLVHDLFDAVSFPNLNLPVLFFKLRQPALIAWNKATSSVIAFVLFVRAGTRQTIGSTANPHDKACLAVIQPDKCFLGLQNDFHLRRASAAKTADS